MSVRVQAIVWQIDLQPSQKLVAIALADHAHEDGTEARPSQATLAMKTGMSDRHVRRILKELVDLGVISVQRPAGQHRATCYRFNMGETRPDTMSALKKSRPDISASRPDICDTQTGHPCPTNHKEPLLEPAPDMAEIKKRNRQIFQNRK